MAFLLIFGKAREDFGCHVIELGESEALISKVFHGSSKVVEAMFIDDEKSVVEALEGVNCCPRPGLFNVPDWNLKASLGFEG